jgi:hypothetical protein
MFTTIKRLLIVMAVLSCSAAMAGLPPLRTSDDGGDKKVTTTIDFTGAGVETTWSGTDATVTIDASGASGNFTGIDLDGDTGTAEEITNSDTIMIAGGTNINTAVAATDTVTVNLDDDITLTGAVFANAFVGDGSKLTGLPSGVSDHGALTGLSDDDHPHYALDTDLSTTAELEAQLSHDNLIGFVANEHIDWTQDQGATNINSNNYTDTNTTYSAGWGLVLNTTTFSASPNLTNGVVMTADTGAWDKDATDDLTKVGATALYEPLGVAVADITDASANGRSLISSANYASMRGLLDLEAGTDFYSIAGMTTVLNDYLTEAGAIALYQPIVTEGSLANSVIVSDDIKAGTIVDSDMGNDGLDPDKLVGDSVDDDKIGSSIVLQNAGTNIANDLEEEVTEGSLADSTIVSDDIKNETIASADILNGTISGLDLGADSVGADELSNSAAIEDEVEAFIFDADAETFLGNISIIGDLSLNSNDSASVVGYTTLMDLTGKIVGRSANPFQSYGGTGTGGYTTFSQFDGETAWRVWYSNADGDVTELELGADGTYLKSNGASSAPSFATPTASFAGNMSGNRLYDSADNLDIVDNVSITGNVVVDGNITCSGYVAQDTEVFDFPLDFDISRSTGGYDARIFLYTTKMPFAFYAENAYLNLDETPSGDLTVGLTEGNTPIASVDVFSTNMYGASHTINNLFESGSILGITCTGFSNYSKDFTQSGVFRIIGERRSET